jgi:GNAT superfamily N-acetyltransferase
MASVTQGDSPAQDRVTVTPVVSRRDRQAFVDLPYTLYAHTPQWIPPLRRDEHRRLSARHNPFFDHATIDLWLGQRDGRTVGRIAAINDRLHDETHGERITWFGFFEAADAAAAQALLAAVEAHAAARGSSAVRGPANPSLNESAGLLVDAFENEPYVLMPYNPPAYSAYIEAAGYSKAKDLLAWHLDVTVRMGSRLERISARLASRRGVVVRPVEMTRAGFDRDLGHLKTIYRAAWVDNWGFVPPTDREIDQLARELRPVIDPEMVLFAEVDGAMAGCAVALPDVNQVLKRMRGRILPFGIWHFLRRRTLMDRVRVLLLGVLPAYRRLGLYPRLIAELHRRALTRGYRQAELSWTLEDNDLVNAGIEAVGGRRDTTYRIYEKPVG